MNIKGTAYITRKDTIIKNFWRGTLEYLSGQTGSEGQIF